MKSALTERNSGIGRIPNRIVTKTVTAKHSEDCGQDDRLDIPWDLSEWVDKPTLLQWIVEDIDTLDWDNTDLVEYLRQHPDYQPKMLLQLLTYAYSTGAFGAQDVELIFYEDKDFQTLGWDRSLTVKSISRFRRENRGLFKWTIYQVLQKAIRRQFDLGDRLFPAGLKRYLVEKATERLDLARLTESEA